MELLFLNSRISESFAFPLVEAIISLSSLTIDSSVMKNVSLSSAFPSSDSLLINGTLFNNTGLPASVMSPCSLSAGYKTAVLMNSELVELQGQGRCTESLLTSYQDVNLSIRDCVLRGIKYDGNEDFSSPSYWLIDIYSGVGVIERTVFELNEVWNSQELVTAEQSDLIIKDSNFTSNIGTLWKVTQGTVLISGCEVLQNRVPIERELSYVKEASKMYIQDTNFVGNTGGYSTMYVANVVSFQIEVRSDRSRLQTK